MATDKEILEYASVNPGFGRDKLKKIFSIGSSRAKRLLKFIRDGGKTGEYSNNISGSSGGDVGNSDETTTIEGNDNSKSITTKSRSIRTLDEALSAAQVDLDDWEVERYLINKWEVAAKTVDAKVTWVDGKKSGFENRDPQLTVQPLWQVKVWLRRKSPVITATESMLERVKANAPVYPRITRPEVTNVRRSLEVSIMDPHVGLITHYPEGDSTQTLESVKETILTALDDLILKAESFGPFEEVFMPFGNDFTHVDNVFHTTTAGTIQPEAEAWHRVYIYAEEIAIQMVNRLRQIAPVFIYEVPGNHSRMADFTLARLLKAQFHNCGDVTVDASSSPFKFHRYGSSLIGYEHGHSVAQVRLAALMASERPQDWAETWFREWHLGDQHRKGSSKPSMLEEQGVSVEYLPGLTVPNEWHRLKSFNHQKRGAMAFVYDFEDAQIARLQYNINMKLLRKG